MVELICSEMFAGIPVTLARVVGMTGSVTGVPTEVVAFTGLAEYGRCTSRSRIAHDENSARMDRYAFPIGWDKCGEVYICCLFILQA